MSTYLTSDEARKSLRCPVARIFGGDVQTHCRGSECAVWRWKPRLATDPGYASAIKREMILMAKEHNEHLADGQKTKTEAAFHKEATAAVTRDPEGFGIVRDQGACGMGGPVT